MKSIKDHDHIQNGKHTKIAVNQQPSEQKRELKIKNCKCSVSCFIEDNTS